MAILKIAKMGHPVLKRAADPVPDPKAPEIHRLIADMVDTLADAPGVGLSAPQVHVPKRVVIFFIPASRAGEGGEEEGDEEEKGDEEEETEPVPDFEFDQPVRWSLSRVHYSVAVPITQWDRHRRLFAFDTAIDYSALVSTAECTKKVSLSPISARTTLS